MEAGRQAPHGWKPMIVHASCAAVPPNNTHGQTSRYIDTRLIRQKPQLTQHMPPHNPSSAAVGRRRRTQVVQSAEGALTTQCACRCALGLDGTKIGTDCNKPTAGLQPRIHCSRGPLTRSSRADPPFEPWGGGSLGAERPSPSRSRVPLIQETDLPASPRARDVHKLSAPVPMQLAHVQSPVQDSSHHAHRNRATLRPQEHPPERLQRREFLHARFSVQPHLNTTQQ